MSRKKIFRNLTGRLFLIALLALLWWWFRRPQPEAAPQSEEPAEIPLPPEPSIPLTSQPADDLTLINGIGPKIASVLQAAGVTTFAQLASMDADQVWQILRAANIRLGAPEKWIEQAKHLP